MSYMSVGVSIHPDEETVAEVRRNGGSVWLSIGNKYGSDVAIFLNDGIADKIRDALANEPTNEPEADAEGE